jgi:ABC-type molybdate transport system ATPase subunit
MTINLEEFVGKTVEITYRNGKVLSSKIEKLPGDDRFFPYELVYKGRKVTYNVFGCRYEYDTSFLDIIKIKEIKETPTEPETMSNVIRSKIDIFTTEDERVEVTLDDDGLFLTACSKGAREDLSIGSKDLVIAVAKAILEHYQETQK